jgi:predicted thioesterase
VTDPVPGSATLRFTVDAADTARALGSGSLEVLATPRLLAWSEAATCAAIEDEMAPSDTSVGTRVQLEHRAASQVGTEVAVTARVVHRDGRLVRFEVTAVDGADRVVGHGEVTRVVVDRERFLGRLGG